MVVVATVLHTEDTVAVMVATVTEAIQLTELFRFIPCPSTEYRFTVVDTAVTVADIATATSLFGCTGPIETRIAPRLIWSVELTLRQDPRCLS